MVDKASSGLVHYLLRFTKFAFGNDPQMYRNPLWTSIEINTLPVKSTYSTSTKEYCDAKIKEYKSACPL
jgi:hypothetical protein